MSKECPGGEGIESRAGAETEEKEEEGEVCARVGGPTP